MVERICIDSDVLIALLRKDEGVKNLLHQDADYCITSISSFEIWHGRRSEEPVCALLNLLSVLALDDVSSRLAADMLLELKKKGTVIDIKVLFIASICITNHIPLLTYNKKHFERLKEFGLILV